MSVEMEQLFPEIYNPVPDAPTNTASPYNKSPYNSFNYGVNMWSPLNQWFDENRASYDEKLQGIGGLLGEGAGVLGAYMTGMENPMDLLNMATNDSGTDNTNQPQDDINVNQNVNQNQNNNDPMSVSNQVNKPSYSTQGWYGGHSGGQTDPLTSISSQYNSGPGLFSLQTGKDLLNLGTGALGFGPQSYDDIDWNQVILQQGGTAPYGVK